MKMAVVFLFAFCLAPLPLLRADVTGAILGTVHDESSAAVPNVTVEVTNLETNQKLKTVTDTAGLYRFLALPIGRYRVDVSQTGFSRFVEEPIVLNVDEQRRVDVTFEGGNRTAARAWR